MTDGDSMVEVCPQCGTTGGFRYRVRTHNTPTGGDPEDPYYCGECKRSFTEPDTQPPLQA